MKKVLPTVLIILVFLTGIAIFLYPSVSNYLYEKSSSKAITEHEENLSKISPETIAKEKEAVAKYNKSLFENAVVLTDPFDPDAYPITDGEYTELLAFDDVMAYIEIPAIDVYLPVYHGTKEETLQIGVGHLENTSLPAGGSTTHAVLSAHCGLPSARLFTDLHLLKNGNIFRIYVLDEVLTYQVYDIETVDPRRQFVSSYKRERGYCHADNLHALRKKHTQIAGTRQTHRGKRGDKDRRARDTAGNDVGRLYKNCGDLPHRRICASAFRKRYKEPHTEKEKKG